VRCSTRAGPETVIEREGLGVADSGEVAAAVTAAIDDNPDAVSDYHDGDEGAINFLVGQVMQATGGSADPGEVNGLLREELSWTGRSSMHVTVEVVGEGTAEYDLPDDATYADLIREAGYHPQEASALVDGSPVPGDRLVDAESVRLLRLIKGGSTGGGA